MIEEAAGGNLGNERRRPSGSVARCGSRAIAIALVVLVAHHPLSVRCPLVKARQTTRCDTHATTQRECVTLARTADVCWSVSVGTAALPECPQLYD